MICLEKTLQPFTVSQQTCPPEVACDGMAWLNGRFLKENKGNRDFAQESLDYELSMLKWIGEMKESNPKRALYHLDFLMTDYELRGKNELPADALSDELSAEADNVAYVEALKELDELSNDKLSAVGVGSNKWKTTEAVDREADKLMKKYGNIPEIVAILEMLKKPAK